MDRLRIYPWLIGFICLCTLAVMVMSAEQNITVSGKPIGADYITYWSASLMAERGELVNSYRLDAIAAVQKLAAPVTSVWGWFYPPTFALLLAPLTTDDYFLSWAIFSLVTMLVFMAAIWLVKPPKLFMPALLLAPAVFINLGNGQNASLTAGIAGIGLVHLEKRPQLAGIMLGLLTIKPQLAVPVFIFLLLQGQYAALTGMIISATALIAVSVARYGVDSWPAWAGAIQLANTLNLEGHLPWQKMSSLFSCLRALGWPALAAQAAQAALAVTVIFAVWRRFQHTTELTLRHAAWIAASLTLSPHLFNYDMLWLVISLAFLATCAERLTEHVTRKVLPAVAFIWFYPLVAPLLHSVLGFNLEWTAPLLMLLILHYAEHDIRQRKQPS